MTAVSYDHKGTMSPIGAGADSCRVCHSASSFDLGAESDATCFECHHDTESKSLKTYKHTEVVNNSYPTVDCEGCHKLHKADSKPLLIQSESELCGGCHPETQEYRSHPVVDLANFQGPRIVGSDGQPITCASHCHDVHGADYKYFCRLEPGRELCISCHKDFD